MHWVDFFRRQGAKVTLSAPSKVKAERDWGSLNLPQDVHVHPLPLNQSSVKEVLKEINPDLVMFDRFILEEQFGHFVYECCPQALVVMETQDLHFIRRARDGVKEKFLTTENLPQYFYRTDTALRETSAIMRCDFSFVVSSFEEKLLGEEFQIGLDRVKWVPFFYDEPIVQKSHEITFSERSDFVWIGNFRHAPNLDGLRWFRNEIWPTIHQAIPEAELKIFGAYPTDEVSSWNRVKNGVQVLGSAKGLDEVYSNARVNLAPLRFGAGVKGKILEGFRYGVPCVTTRVGEEGICPLDSKSFGSEYDFGGTVLNDQASFAKACVELYQNERLWLHYRKQAASLMAEVYDVRRWDPVLISIFEKAMEEKKSGQLPNWTARVLRHELFNSHKYFSKWIEVKESIENRKN